MKKIILIQAALFLLSGSFAWANPDENTRVYEVKGTVLDEKGNPLPGASVYIPGTTAGAGTNAKGEFSFRIREGNHTVRVTFTGYTPLEYSVAVPQNSGLACQLLPSENSMDEVVVTGTRTEKPLKDTPVLTRVISNEQILKLNPMNMQQVLEFELPGIQFGRHHGTGLPTVTFQGSDGDYVLFLVDGERVGGEGAADNIDFDRFNIDDIERIEIIRGAMSTLYGSNALGGVINIITKKANRPIMGTVSGQYSDRDMQKYSASIGSKLDRFSTLTTVSYREKDAYTVEDTQGTITVDPETGEVTEGTPGTTSVMGYEIWQASQKFTYAFTEKLSANLGGSFYENRQLTTNPDAKTQDFFRDFTGNFKMNYILGEKHRMDASYSMDKYAKYTDYIVSDRSDDKEYDNFNQTIRVTYAGDISENDMVIAGVEFDHESLKHYWFADTTSHRVHNYVIYAQEERKFGERFTLVTGIRADIHSRYGLHVTPKISAMYKVCDFTIRGGYASGFRSPSLKDLYSEWSHQGMFYIIGNPDLKPETSHQLSLSGEYTRGIFNASVSGYYNEFKDKIEYGAVQYNEEMGRNEYIYENMDEAKTTGLDATLQIRLPEGLTLRGSYAYVDDHKTLEGKNTSTVRPHSATFSADLNFPAIERTRISLGFYGRWMSGVHAWRQQTDGSFVYRDYDARTFCSANASIQFPRGVRLNFNVDNILDFRDKNISGDTSISPARGTTFVLGLSINLADMFKL